MNRSDRRTDDPYGGRRPTSHERLAGQPWNRSYRDGSAPWDIGGPQPAVVRLVSAGAFRGSVLDAGCGTGDNALHIAAHGLRPLGMDVAESAVSIARDRAAARRLGAEFMVADALRLSQLERGAGPHPVSRQELTAPFTRDPSWRIASIGAEQLLTRFAPDGVPAWIATVERVARA